MRQRLEVSSNGITVRSARGRVRHLDAAEVRRIHSFVDASGDQGIVIRKSLLRFVYVPLAALNDTAVSAGVSALVDRVRIHAHIDPHVEQHLAGSPMYRLLAA